MRWSKAMFRTVAWIAAAVLVGSLALFVPVDPSVLEKVGLIEDDSSPAQGVTATRSSVADGHSTRSVSATLSEPVPVRGDTPAPTREPAPRQAQSPAPTIINAELTAPATLPPGTVPVGPTGGSVLARSASPPTVASARALQRELTRHGCYNGAIDGDWGPASRYAAAMFTRAVNAALPADEPDAALLVLARRHPGGACRNDGANAITTAATGSAAAASTAVIATTRYAASLENGAVQARPLTQAPRIVPSTGQPAMATITPTAPPAGMTAVSPSRMALGLELPTNASPGNAPLTQTPPVEGEAPEARSRQIRRVERKSQRNRASTSRRARRWRRKVYNPIDLNGS
jgi:hypothetical protein